MSDLVPRVLLGDLDLTEAPYLLEFGSNLGEPTLEFVTLSSGLRDGEILSSSRALNRSITLPVLIEGADMAELADAEAALVIECDKDRNTLTIDPGDGYGAASVYQTFRIQAKFVRNDDMESALIRRYDLTLTCLPFSRSATPTVIGSEFVSDSVTIADDCQSTTGWAPMAGKSGAGYAPTFSVDSTAGNFVTGTGSIKVSPAPGTPNGYGTSYVTSFTAFSVPLSIDASGGGYVTFALRGEWNFSVYEAYLTTSGGGRQLVSALSSASLDDGFVRYSLPVPHASTVTLLELDVWQNLAVPPGSSPAHPFVWVDSIGLAAVSTSAQQTRSLDIGGSARTEGQIAISAPAGLGDVVLYTARDLDDGFRPDLRRGQTVGTNVTDSTAVNGSYVTLSGTAAVFERPASMFRPGAYAVLARAKSSLGTVGAVVSAQTVIGGTAIGGTESASATRSVGAFADYVIFRVGVLHLPPTLVEATATNAVVRFSVTQAINGTHLDELMIFPMEDAALTWVECGTGSPSATVASRLWVDGPTLEKPRGQILVGNDEDRLDARAARPLARGSHMLYPGKMLAYLLCSAAGGAAMQTTYYKAWHTHAGS